MLSRQYNLKQAEEQKKKDKLKGPGYFFYPVKTTLNSINAYREAEVYSLMQLEEYLRRWAQKLHVNFPEVAVQKKYDGVSCTLHRRSDGKLFVFSDNGTDLTQKFRWFLDRLPNERDDYIIQGEVVGWVEGKHLGREQVAGLLNAKEYNPLIEKLTWCIYDVVWFDGADLHKKTYKERYTLLKKRFSFKYSLLTKYRPGFNLVPTFVCANFTSLKKAIQTVAAPPESEGAMIKLWNGFQYNLNGSTADIIKFKKYAEAHFIVLSKRLIKGAEKTFAYEIGVLVLPSELKKVQAKYLRELPGHKNQYLYVGKTFNTNVEAKVGDVITVKFHNLFVHYDEDHKMRLGIYEPRVYENRSKANKNEMPDTVTSLIHIGEEANLLVEKGRIYFQKAGDVFLDFAPASTRYKFIIHEHFRGRTAHGDLRILHPSKKFLIGWTLMNQIEGSIKEPVLTMEKGIELLKDDSNWKFNPVNGVFATRRTRSGVEKLVSIESVMKKPEPLDWLSVQGIAPIGSPGSTKNYPGVFVIATKGFCEYGFQAPHFHEYFFYCERWKDKGMRLVFRLLGSEFSQKEILELVCQDEVKGVFLDAPSGYELSRCGNFYFKVLPPSDEQESRATGVWLMIKSLDLIPYVLSKRAVQKKRMPPFGASALPSAIEKQIPKEYRYWEEKDPEKACHLRDELVGKLSELGLKFDQSMFRKLVAKSEGARGKFVLKHRFWKGQHVVRWGLSQEYWDLYYKVGKDVFRFECFSDPQTSDSFAARFYSATEDEMEHEGSIKPNTKLNPNKELEAKTEKVTQGEMVLEKDETNVKVLALKSRKLSGAFKFEKDEGTKIWLASRV